MAQQPMLDGKELAKPTALVLGQGSESPRLYKSSQLAPNLRQLGRLMSVLSLLVGASDFGHAA